MYQGWVSFESTFLNALKLFQVVGDDTKILFLCQAFCCLSLLIMERGGLYV